MKNWFYNESLLIYLWQLRKYDPKKLKTTAGDAIIIQDPGIANSDSGPDFSNAKLIVGDTSWYGMVEMHWFSSNWYLHNHQDDEAYNNVILHVVFEEDRIVYNGHGERLPCLELKDRIPPKLLSNFTKLQDSQWIPCEKLISTVPDITKTMCMERLTIERLQSKTERITFKLNATTWNWEEVCYQLLTQYIGSSVNTIPFEKLASNTPLSILLKHQQDLQTIEALLFGQAGFLEDQAVDEYTINLKSEYQYLQKKYKLQSMKRFEWKFLRLRPQNFPTVRIAQLASLIHQNGALFRKIVECVEIDDLRDLLTNSPSSYWQDHYLLDIPSKPVQKTLGKQEINILITNAIVPLVFQYGSYKKEAYFKDLALRWLECMPAEKNNIITKWSTIGMHAMNSGQSQALLQLHKQHCTPKKCLRCTIGHSIISETRLHIA